MPDITFWTAEGGEKVSDEDQEYFTNYQSFWFSEPAATERRIAPKRKRATAPKLPGAAKAQRQSAYHMMRTLDKALLIMLGVGFAYFMHSTDEEDKRHHEGYHPTLVMHFDEASQGFAMIWYLLDLPMRIVPIRDPFHREWNDCRLALSRSELWWVVLITSVVVNLPFGPWDGSSWWGRMIGMAADQAQRSHANTPLFVVLYGLIARDLGETATGTPEHMHRRLRSVVGSVGWLELMHWTHGGTAGSAF